jgi:hypothetical protein
VGRFVGKVSPPLFLTLDSPASLLDGSVLRRQASHLLLIRTNFGYGTVLTAACARQGCSATDYYYYYYYYYYEVIFVTVFTTSDSPVILTRNSVVSRNKCKRLLLSSFPAYRPSHKTSRSFLSLRLGRSPSHGNIICFTIQMMPGDQY